MWELINPKPRKEHKYMRQCRIIRGGCGSVYRTNRQNSYVCPNCQKVNKQVGIMKRRGLIKW